MTSLSKVKAIVFGEDEIGNKTPSFLFPMVPYTTLKFKKRTGHKKKLLNKSNHRGFDTETNYKGDIVLLSDDQGRNIWNPSLDDLLQFLTYKEYRKTINWYYNITFDAESILKMLPEAELEEILEDNKTEYNGFKLFYLPHKYLKISDKNKHNVDFYDIAQFYAMSLDNASKRYLNDTKGVADIKSLMEYIYYDKVQNVVSVYCKHDCELTKGLAEIMYQGVIDCNIPFSKPYSGASLAETAFLDNCDVPEYLDAPLGVNKYFYWSYYAGWFELLKRGYHNSEIIEYDINSAYPYAMLNLPDTRDLTWERVRKESKDNVMGVYLCAISPKTSTHISPVQVRTQAVSVHPHGSTMRYVTDDELQMLKDVYKVKIISGFEAFGDNLRYPFREYIEKLYLDKSRYKNKDAMMYASVKRVLNGFYGKNIQRTGGRIGNCFNPIYASKTTSSCRRQVWEAVKDHQKSVIGIQTDSAIMTEEIDIDLGEELGQWGEQRFNEGIFLLSGVYELMGETKKTKIRGYDTKMELKEMLMKYPDKNTVEIAKEKPLHLKQALGRSKWNVNQTNQFITDIKTISCKYDQKRVWGDECENWREFCSEYYESTPITTDYRPITESEYLKCRMQVMKVDKERIRDGEGRILLRGM